MMAVFVLAAAPFAETQTIAETQTKREGTCQFGEVFNRDGWPIPPLGKMIRRNVVYKTPNGEAIADSFAPRHVAGHVVLLYCSSDQPGRLEYERQDIDITEITRFRANGHVFAYQVIGQAVGVTGGRRVAIGRMENLIYYDFDGTGVFQYVRSGSTIPFQLLIPEWTRETHRDGVPEAPRDGH